MLAVEEQLTSIDHRVVIATGGTVMVGVGKGVVVAGMVAGASGYVGGSWAKSSLDDGEPVKAAVITAGALGTALTAHHWAALNLVPGNRSMAPVTGVALLALGVGAYLGAQ